MVCPQNGGHHLEAHFPFSTSSLVTLQLGMAREYSKINLPFRAYLSHNNNHLTWIDVLYCAPGTSRSPKRMRIISVKTILSRKAASAEFSRKEKKARQVIPAVGLKYTPKCKPFQSGISHHFTLVAEVELHRLYSVITTLTDIF